MKTMFTMGFASLDFWNQPPPIHPYLGQTVSTGDLNEAQRNTVYAGLKDTVAKGMEIDAWIHSAGEEGQRAALGEDYGRFRGYIDYAADLAPDVYPVYQRLGSDNREDWWIADGDDAKIGLMSDAVNSAYQIYSAKVKGVRAPAPTPALRPAPKPGVPTAVPRAPAPQAPTKGVMPPPQPMILGVNANDLLIGGGLAVGLGIAIYALA